MAQADRRQFLGLAGSVVAVRALPVPMTVLGFSDGLGDVYTSRRFQDELMGAFRAVAALGLPVRLTPHPLAGRIPGFARCYNRALIVRARSFPAALGGVFNAWLRGGRTRTVSLYRPGALDLCAATAAEVEALCRQL